MNSEIWDQVAAEVDGLEYGQFMEDSLRIILNKILELKAEIERLKANGHT